MFLYAIYQKICYNDGTEMNCFENKALIGFFTIQSGICIFL